MRLGVVQMCSARGHEQNSAFVAQHMAQAKARGCDLVALPEVAGCMDRNARDYVGLPGDDPFLRSCSGLARETGIWVHCGSTPVQGGGDGRLFNHSVLFDDTGARVASYNKIHLFDIHPEGGKPIRESNRYAPGDRAVIAPTPWGPMAMTICYDLRFPSLYRVQAQNGAGMAMIPSAFTVPTGKAHWHVLLRARAIENGMFVIAAAQVGHHEDGRETFGHSLVVDPWGDVLLDMEDQIGLGVIDLDMAAVARARQRIPALSHDAPYSVDQIESD